MIFTVLTYHKGSVRKVRQRFVAVNTKKKISSYKKCDRGKERGLEMSKIA